MSEYIHLHNHTHYSLQDGACTVDTLIAAAKKHNMHAVALTDHGVMYGLPEFYKKAKKEGIKPIMGMEAYIVSEGSRFTKSKIDEIPGRRKKKHYNHLILLAKNKIGYKNLEKLSTLGFTEGFYYRPRIDLELLRKYSEGLICTSACVGGVVATHLVNNDYDSARSAAITYKDIFGDDFYLEIQDHKLEAEQAMLAGMPKLSKELGIKLVATNDCHYINREDAIAHNILLLLSDKTGEADYNKLRYGTDEIYFKSQDEMIHLFKKYKGAIENTLEIEEKINVNLDFEGHHFPIFPIPKDSPAKTLDDYFELLSREGLNKKFKTITPQIEDRFTFEIKTIREMGFAGYFLIVQDFINAAKKMDIPVGPGRGSVAGSLVAFALGITAIDPLKYDLLFERFLNPERKSMPDIDVDFADDGRADVIEYVKNLYGSECVSQIITFNRLSSKAVLRDVARVLKIPIPTVNSITKFIPSKFGKVFSIDEALKDVPELRWVRDSKEDIIQKLIKYGKTLEGMNRNASKHAAGVVIAPGDVSEYVPLASASQQTEIVTQYNMKELENAGLLKMDFLGLRTLTIIKDTLKLIKQNHNVVIDIDEIPLDDSKTYLLFSKGQTTGIFQFESPPMREYLKKLKPNSINDLSAMNALYRPGPMEFIDDFIDRKFGRKEIKYLHSILESILKETYGIIVYQEQVIQIANKVAGMTLAQADLLRRAMGKKDLKAMREQQVIFVKGATENEIPQKAAIEIFEAVNKFANYGFNKSHSVAYSVVAYQTAYLKAHYTPEFLAANLTHEFGDKTKVGNFLEDCRKLQIPMLPPDINKPTVSFNVEKKKIRFGFSAIKNVGVGAIEEIIRSKEKLGKNFTSIFNFTSNVDTRTVNKRGLEGLILAGAFDLINKNRRQLFESVEQALAFGSMAQSYKQKNTSSLFGVDGEEEIIEEPILHPVEEWTEKERLSKEREVTGFYVTGHPLRKYELEHRSFAGVNLGETETMEKLDSVRAVGIITNLTTKIDKKGKTMAFFNLDDFTGSCECLMFASVYEKHAEFVKEETAVLILGRPESSGDAIKVHVEELVPIDKVQERFTKYCKITIDKEKFGEEIINPLKSLFEKNQGSIPVMLEVVNNGSLRSLFVLKLYRIKLTSKFISAVSGLLGEESLILVSK